MRALALVALVGLGACHRLGILRAWIIPGVLLAADIGNTQSHMGLFEGDELVQHWRFATRVDATADELAVGVSTLLGLRGLEAGTVDAVDVVFAKFQSAIATPPTTLRILPVAPPPADGRPGGAVSGAVSCVSSS